MVLVNENFKANNFREVGVFFQFPTIIINQSITHTFDSHRVNEMRLTTESKRRGLMGMGMGMGRRRPLLMVGIVLVVVLGSAVYFRLWSIDYNFSSEDREFLRRQFDLANRDAMDESAEWRYKYDEEVKKSGLCLKQLNQVKENLKIKMNEADGTSINKKLAMLKQENIGLRAQVESLTQELQTKKFKCGGL